MNQLNIFIDSASTADLLRENGYGENPHSLVWGDGEWLGTFVFINYEEYKNFINVIKESKGISHSDCSEAVEEEARRMNHETQSFEEYTHIAYDCVCYNNSWDLRKDFKVEKYPELYKWA